METIIHLSYINHVIDMEYITYKRIRKFIERPLYCKQALLYSSSMHILYASLQLFIASFQDFDLSPRKKAGDNNIKTSTFLKHTNN